MKVEFNPLDFIIRLATLVPKSKINLTLYHGMLTPNHREREMVKPIKISKAVAPTSSKEVRSPSKCHATLNWTQCLKRVLNSDIEICGRCSGAIKVILFAEN